MSEWDVYAQTVICMGSTLQSFRCTLENKITFIFVCKHFSTIFYFNCVYNVHGTATRLTEAQKRAIHVTVCVLGTVSALFRS